jgi:ribosomal protein S6--L-glutamate ligase
MNFLILSRLSNIYSTRRLVQEITDRGHRVSIENPESLCENISADILIPRLGNFRYEESLANLVHLQETKKPKVILNGPPSFHNARHKKLALQILSKLPQPQLFDQVNSYPVVVKDCLSSQGDGVFLCRNPEELKKCLYKLQGREVLFQEFISESQGHDIRVFVIGLHVIAVMERLSMNPEIEFRSNLSLGGHAQPISITKEEENLCITAVQKLGLHYAGIDFVRSQRGPLILEVNPCPGLEGIEKCSQINIAKAVILYAENLFRSHS